MCPACHAQNLVFTRFVRVFDIFWIPVFPFEKHDHVGCESCGSSYYSENFPGAQEARREGKAPWWSFLGAFIIAGIVALGMFSACQSEAKIHAFKKNPSPGKYFVFKSNDPDLSRHPYVFAKIDHMDGEKMTIGTSALAYSSLSDATRDAKKKSDDLLDSHMQEVMLEDFQKMNIKDVS
ncbi:MAG: hypothetical protein C0514_04285 [Candidatus Puniceispirillum sp.]|nr:hypothetical protein [Candidatus Puniceispirillum sp.]